MNTAVLISFIEAELNRLDPKHRTLEVELVAYGTITRVLQSLYAQKVAAEAPPATEAQQEPHTGPVPEPKPYPRYGKGVPKNSNVPPRKCLLCGVQFRPLAASQLTCGMVENPACAKRRNVLTQCLWQHRNGKWTVAETDNQKAALAFERRLASERDRLGIIPRKRGKNV